ncbi:MAG: tributyrin esterase [Planctomycetota bacterium]
MNTPAHNFSISEMSPEELHRAIHALPAGDDETELTEVTVNNLAGQHAALMRIDHPLRIEANGPLGDYAFAHHAQATVIMNGDAGAGLGEGMQSGILRVRGNAGVGAGTGMKGGTLAVYGHAGHRCGAAMRGGEIFVRGDVGEHAGIGALNGTIVIGGNAGPFLGNATSDVTIFIRGEAASLVDGVTESPLRKREELRLGLLLINASIRGDASEFRRIVPIAKLAAEQARQGEIVPNWR